MDSRTNKLVSLCPPRAIYTPTTFLLRSVYVPSAFRPRAFVALMIPPSAVRMCAFHYMRPTTCPPMRSAIVRFECVRSTTCVCVPLHAFQRMRSTIYVPLHAFHRVLSAVLSEWMRSTTCAPMFLRSTMCVPFQNPNVLDHRRNQNTSGPICIGSSYKLKIVSEDEQVNANLYWIHVHIKILKNHLYWNHVQTGNRH